MGYRHRKAPFALAISVLVGAGCDALLGKNAGIQHADGPCTVESVAGGKKVIHLRNGDQIAFDDPHGNRPSIPSAAVFRTDLGCNRITDPNGAVHVELAGGFAASPVRLDEIEYLAALYMDGTRLSEGVAIALKADFDLDMSGLEVQALAARLEQYGMMARAPPPAGETAADPAVGPDAANAAVRAAPLEDAAEEAGAASIAGDQPGKRKRKRKKKRRKKRRKRKRRR
jgi:hypothetical protein